MKENNDIELSKRDTDENNNSISNNQIILVLYNISRNLTRKHLQEIFNGYGSVKGVYIPKDEDTKLPKNYAFVEYEKQTDADKASLYMGGGQIDGLVVRTEVLNPKYYMVVNQKTKEKDKEKEEKKSRSRSRSYQRDKEMLNRNGSKHNDNHTKDKDTNNTKKDKKNDYTNRRRRSNHRRSFDSKSPHSSRSKGK